MVIFAAAIRLRPSELFGLDKRDVDRQLGVVYVRCAYADGRLKHTKTRLSTRAVPLQAKALEALDQLPVSDNAILFPNMRGGRIDFRIFGRKHWRPAQLRAGIEPIRGLSCATRTRPSRSGPACRYSQPHGSWVRASR